VREHSVTYNENLPRRNHCRRQATASLPVAP
jgi:hypothetical protein